MFGLFSSLLEILQGIDAASNLHGKATRFFKHHSREDTSPSDERLHPESDTSKKLQSEFHVERYKESLGKRHRYIREKILQLSLPALAALYDFKKVSFLEKCETGKKELPNTAIEKLEQFFFINSRYLLEGKEPIFQPFDIVSNRKDCRNLLEQGFSPYFLCSPDFEQDGCAFLVFWKEDNNYGRARQSKQPGSFYSSGGGRNNIHNMIYAMLDLGFKPSDVLLLNVRHEEWDRLGRGCWYSKNNPGYAGPANHKAQDIFEDWYSSAQMFDRMANDPELQAEIRAINAEFAVAEQDGLQDV